LGPASAGLSFCRDATSAHPHQLVTSRRRLDPVRIATETQAVVLHDDDHRNRRASDRKHVTSAAISIRRALSRCQRRAQLLKIA
jgi:hypothetical protein